MKKGKKRKSTEQLKVRYKPVFHSPQEIGKLAELLSAQLVRREETGCKKLEIKSEAEKK